jgi:hypothetical protein
MVPWIEMEQSFEIAHQLSDGRLFACSSTRQTNAVPEGEKEPLRFE